MEKLDKILWTATIATAGLIGAAFYFGHNKNPNLEAQVLQQQFDLKDNVVVLTERNSYYICQENAVITIHAPWFGLSNTYCNIFIEKAKEYKGKGIVFAQIELEKCKDAMQALEKMDLLKQSDVNELPYTLFIKDGRRIHTSKGGDPIELERKIKEIYLKDVHLDKSQVEDWIINSTIG